MCARGKLVFYYSFERNVSLRLEMLGRQREWTCLKWSIDSGDDTPCETLIHPSQLQRKPLTYISPAPSTGK